MTNSWTLVSLILTHAPLHRPGSYKRIRPFCDQAFELKLHSGIHWDELDEDISVAGLLAGRGDATRSTKIAA